VKVSAVMWSTSKLNVGTNSRIKLILIGKFGLDTSPVIDFCVFVVTVSPFNWLFDPCMCRTFDRRTATIDGRRRSRF